MSSDQVTSLAAAADGTLYASTLAGASAWDGSRWQPVKALAGRRIFDLALSPTALWAGCPQGVYRVPLPD